MLYEDSSGGTVTRNSGVGMADEYWGSDRELYMVEDCLKVDDYWSATRAQGN